MITNPYLLIGLPCLSAFLFYLGFPNFINIFGFEWLAWFCLIPLFFSLDGQPLKERLKIGALFSFIAFCLLVNWLLPYNIFGYFAFVIALSIGPIFFAVFFPCPWPSKLINLIYVPALWVATEFLRTILLGGFSWSFGHSQAFQTNIIQLADITGAYGLSFILVWINYCLFMILKEPDDRYVYGAGCLLVIIVLWLYAYFSPAVNLSSKSEPIFYEIATIQPNISPTEKWDPQRINEVINKHIHLTQKSLKNREPDIVVWPETAIPDDFIRNPRMRDKVTQIATQVKSHLLIGAALFENERDYNSVVFLNGRGAVLDIYRKKYLIPFSEYLPLKQYFSFLREVFNFNIYDFYPGQSVGVFTIHKKWDKDYQEQKFGVALCSEGGYPVLFRQLVAQGSGFIILMLNDAWFPSKSAMILHAQNEIMRSVENHVPIVRAANSGWSCSIDEFGRVKGNALQRPELMTSGFYLSHVAPNQQKTFYTKFGDIFSVFCLLFVIMTAAPKIKNFL